MSIHVTDHIGPIAQDYDAFLFDLWGVVHNGVAAWPGALRVLEALHGLNKQVILLSNAPRLGVAVDPVLTRFGLPRSHYDRVVASGDMVRHAFETGALDLGSRCVFWGKEPDKAVIAGLGISFADSPDHADFILCAGLTDDHTETVEDYRDQLLWAKQLDMPLVCANPDYEVMQGDLMLPCAGAIALAYQQMGGTTHWFGKPYNVAYDYCQRVLGGVDPSRILAVGDTLRTDIRGATDAGIASVLITSGIHGREIMANGSLDHAGLDRICAEAGLAPVAAMTGLDWQALPPL